MNSEEIWNIYSEKLKYFILKNISDQFEVEDILQDVCVRIQKK